MLGRFYLTLVSYIVWKFPIFSNLYVVLIAELGFSPLWMIDCWKDKNEHILDYSKLFR